MHANSLQQCLTLCDPMDCSSPGFSTPGILQARILGWGVMPSSRGSTQTRDRTCVSYVCCIGGQVLYNYRHPRSPALCLCCVLSHFSCVQLFATLQTVAHQAPLSMGFSSQEYQSGLPCPPPGESSQPRGQAHIFYVSCIGKWVLYYQCQLGRPKGYIASLNIISCNCT